MAQALIVEEYLGAVILVVVVVGFLVGFAGIIWLSSKTGPGASLAGDQVTAWNHALVELACMIGVQHHPSPVAGTHDSVSGSVAGRLVSLSVGADGMMKLRVDGHNATSLMVHRRDVACTAFAPVLPEAARQPTPIGVAEFDAWFVVRGADVYAIHGLRTNQELRALLSHVVATLGAQIHMAEVELVRTPATSAQELLAVLEPMVDLSLWLSDSAGPRPHVGHALRSGTLQLAASLSAQGPQRGEVLRQALSGLAGGQAYFDSNRNTAEWRGESNGFSARVVVDGASDIEVHLKIDNPAVHFNLTRDSMVISSSVSADDPNRVFVGRGICFAQQAPAEEQMAAYQSLPRELTETLCQAMHHDAIMRLWFDPDELAIHYCDPPHEMLDPVGRIRRGVQLLGWAAPQIGSAAAPELQAHRVSCHFCKTIFIHGHHTECPNCGAPHAG